MGCAASEVDPASLEQALRDAMRHMDGKWTDSNMAKLQTAIAQAEAAFPPEGSSLQATLNEAKEVLRSAAFGSPGFFFFFLKKVGWSFSQVKEATSICWEGRFIKPHFNDSDCQVFALLIDKCGGLDKLTVCLRPTPLSACLETWQVHSPDSEHLFDVPYAGT